MPIICASVLLVYLIDLVMLAYVLLKIHIVYYDIFVGGAVVFDRAGQISEFAAWQHLFCILFQ